jgi:hypothetical protein
MKMSPEAKRLAVRLLLWDLARLDPFEEKVCYESVRELRGSLKRLADLYPKRHRLVTWFARARPDELSPQSQLAIDETIALLTAWMPESVVASAESWSLSGPDRFEALANYGPEIVDELVAAYETAVEALDGEAEDDWPVPDDDPGAAPAPRPLAVVQPSKSSGPVKAHPYRGTEQYRVFRALEGNAARRERWNLDGVYGEGQNNCGYGIESSGRTGNPSGRPRLGTTDPDAAASLILEICPNNRIEDLRVCLARGKPSAAVKDTRATLARAVCRILERRRATREALAAALTCNVKTIDRLRAAGNPSDEQQQVA